MKKDDKFDDLEFEDEDLPLAEIELDEEEKKPKKKGKGLKVLLIILIVAALLAAGFFVYRYIQERQTVYYVPSSAFTEFIERPGENISSANTVENDPNGNVTEVVTPTPPPTPTPTPTPPPTPTPRPIPEQYVIPGIDPDDLSAVHDYIQTQLNTMAADVYFPNVEEITANDDCTVFTVICNTLNESMAEREAVEKLYEFGKMYAAYAGKTVENIHIDYKNRVGDLLWTRDSKS